MADTARAAKAAPLRRDAILEAVAYAAERLLLSVDWRDAANDVLARLGIAADVSRAYLLETRPDDGGRPCIWQLAEWCAPEIESQQDNPILRGAPWIASGFGRWVESMVRGEIIQGPIAGFPQGEREALAAQEIRSVIAFPITVEDAWWGCVGFDDCVQERAWGPADVDALRAAATLIGAAIQRQRSDEHHRAAERRYRQFVEQIPAVTYTDLPTGDRMGFVSPQIQTILGLPSVAFLEDPELWQSLIHPEDHARLLAHDAFNPNDLTPFDEEYRMRTADGSWVWVHDTSVPVLADDGSVEYFQGFMIDVTARKQAEERLREAEERFRVLVEQMPAVTYTEPVAPGTSFAMSMDYISPQAEALFGYPLQRWYDDVDFWARICHPDDVDRVTRETHEANAHGGTYSVDYRVVANDGRTVWIHEEATLLTDAKGIPHHWQGFMLDVTQRKLAEEQIRIAEEKFRAIVENTPAISYQELPIGPVYDATSTMSYVSPQIQSILGYEPEVWSSTPGYWAQIVHPDDLPAVLAEGARCTATGEPYSQDYRMIAADGRVVWFRDESHLITDADGVPLVWQGVMIDVTDRKEAEEQLRRAQERLQALVDHMPAVVYIETPDADPTSFYLSPQVERIFGHSAQEWTWTPDFWIDHVHPDDRAAVEEADRITDTTLSTYSMDYRFRCANGEYLWVHDEAVYVPSGDSGGFWQGFLFDITARREAEERVARAERRFRATVEHLPAVVYREDHESVTDRLYISPQVEAVFGYSVDEWRATPGFWLARIHPDDHERIRALNEQANTSKEPFDQEYRFRRSDGTYVWIHDEASFVEEPGGRGWWQGFLLDITERKEAEQLLREAEETFRTIVEENPAVIYTQEIDEEDPSVSRTTYISPRQEALFGYSAEEALNDPILWSRMIHPEDRDRVLAADLASNTGNAGQFSLEYRMIARDGQVVWVQDQAVLVNVGDRRPFWQGFLLDITERKRAQEQLERALSVEREAAGRLRALDDMKNTFLQAVSHDLRTPLAAILGLAITLERGDVQLEEDDAKDLARRIADNARRLDRLVTNLLDLDRLARGIVAPKVQPTDVGSLVRRLVAESELIPEARLRTDIQPVVIEADAAKVERIVENLLANTARHTPASATVWVSVRPVPDGVLIAIEDDGPGVPPDLRETVFEPFQQGPDAPQHSPGVGVGLTLVRRFAELHGGRAWVEERPGGGASFLVFLPAEPPADAGGSAD